MSEKKFKLRHWFALIFFGIFFPIGIFFSGIFNYDRWKEEALQYDGSIIVVERYAKYPSLSGFFGFPTIIDSQSLTINMPGTTKRVVWEDEYSEDLQSASFSILALHVFKNQIYVVVQAYMCNSYNKWNRPNPPYIFFKYDGVAWRQISISEFPIEIQHINLTVGNTGPILPRDPANGTVLSDTVSRKNETLSNEKFKRILRVPMNHDFEKACPVMYFDKGYERTK